MNTIKDDLAARLRYLMRKENLKQKELAEMVSTSPQSVNNWLKRNAISRESAQILCGKTGYSLDWLLNGNGKPKGEGSNFRESQLSVTEWNEEQAESGEFVEVPVIDVSLSAGDGAYSIGEEQMYTLPFRAYTLRQIGVQPSDSRVVKVTGDSMEPKLSDGDTVAINTADKRIRDGKMYAIRMGDIQRIKILIETPSGIIIRSLNPQYADEIITPEQMADGEFSIIGRVWWISSLL